VCEQPNSVHALWRAGKRSSLNDPSPAGFRPSIVFAFLGLPSFGDGIPFAASRSLIH
jgi:hypothetical protein